MIEVTAVLQADVDGPWRFVRIPPEVRAALAAGARGAVPVTARLGEREWALWKPRWGAFHRTGLDAHLRAHGVTTVVLAGCNYPNCPRATVYGASERDYRVLLASDAVSGVAPHHLEEAGRMGVGHAPTREVLDAQAAATGRGAPR